MLKNYFLIAQRNLLKYKGQTFINVVGLAVGVAATLLIGLYSHHELTFDTHHPIVERTYLLYKQRVTPAGTQNATDTWAPLLKQLQEDYPEVEKGSRLFTQNVWVSHEEDKFNYEVSYIDKDFFSLFDMPLAIGKTITEPSEIVISKKMAMQFFGDKNPLGKTLQVDFGNVYTVVGVLAENKSNSSIQVEIAVLLESHPRFEEFSDSWGGSFLETYISLDQNNAYKELESKFPDFLVKVFGEEVAARTNFKLMPLVELHNWQTNSEQYAYILLIVAACILLIAIINFMNLSTARSMERAKEIGVRKVMGARKKQLIAQFLTEAIVLSFLGLFVGCIIALLALPYVNNLFQVALSFPKDVFVLGGLISFGVFLGVFTGSYPAFFISNFKLLNALKGSGKKGLSGRVFRNVLVVVQFSVSVCMIIGTLIVKQQIDYMQETDLAFQKENVVVLPISLDDFEDEEQAAQKLTTLKDKLGEFTEIESISSSAHVPSMWEGWFAFTQPDVWEGDPLRMRLTFGDHQYFETFGMEFLEGRGFQENSSSDREESVIINEAAVKAFGWEKGVGNVLQMGRGKFNVVGVVKDYHFETLANEVAPIMHFYRQQGNGVHNYISLKIKGNNPTEMVNQIKAEWHKQLSGQPFNYFYLDDTVASMYQTENQFLSLFTLFAFVAVLIACMGLYGLTTFIMEKKRKEISIRKVLGASVSGIVWMSSKWFGKYIVVAFILAGPLAVYFMQKWLTQFAYQTTIGLPVFFITALLIFTIAGATISIQSVKSALLNPAKTLKEE